MKPCEVCGLRECNHRVPKDLQEELDADVAAEVEYYKPSYKIVCVPVEVKYHEPTDVIYSMSANGEMLVVGANKYRELCFTVEDVERVMRDNPVRKIIEAEINLYEYEIEGWKNDDTIVDRINRQMEIDKLKAAIKALKLLANKF